MKKFKDAQKREWKITVNVRTAKAVRDLTGIDLFAMFKGDADRWIGDPIALVNVLYALLSDQVAERKLTEDDFAEAMFGDAIEHGAQALARETADFFPASQCTVLNRVLDKAETTQREIAASALKAIETMDLSPTSTTQP